MAKKSFQVGILDKAGRNVKSAEGWVPTKGNEGMIDWTLEENERHKGLKEGKPKEKTDKVVSDPKPPAPKKTKKELEKIAASDVGDLSSVMGAAPTNVSTIPIELTYVKEVYKWGKLLAIKQDDNLMLSIPENTIKDIVLTIVSDTKEKSVANPITIEFDSKEGEKCIAMDWYEKDTPIVLARNFVNGITNADKIKTGVVKVMLVSDTTANAYLAYEAFDFSFDTADFKPESQSKEEKKKKSDNIKENNKANAKNYKVPAATKK